MGKRGEKKRGTKERMEIKQSVSKVALLIPRRYSFAISLLLIILVNFLIYSNTFSSPFQFDDGRNIEKNLQLRFLSNFWPPSGVRYIGYLSFAINYHFGGLDVFGYHLVNLIIHIINGILVWCLVILTFKTPVMEKACITHLSSFVALTSSLLFASHPVQTQAVTYIVQRFASLAALFYLLSLALYVRGRLSYQIHNTRPRAIVYIVSSILSAILAMKTKEMSFTLPFMIVLYEVMFFYPSRIITRCLFLMPFLIPIPIIPLSMVGVDKPIGEMIGEMGEVAQMAVGLSRTDYFLTQFRVIVTYIRLLFLPIDQNLDYDYPIYTQIFRSEVFLSFIFLLFIFGLGIYLFIRSRRKNSGPTLLASFGIFWFFMALSVESSIIPINDVIFEHRLYLPSVGAVIAFSSAIFYWVDHARLKLSPMMATSMLLLVTVLPLSMATYSRNQVWRDGITLWHDVVEKSPGKGRGYTNLGLAYHKKGNIDEAIEEYKKAVILDPLFPEIHLRLGAAYDKKGQLDKAIHEYTEALRLKPDYPEAHINIGVAYYKKGQLNEAIEEYREALRLSPDYPEAHYGLGDAYYKKGQLDAAIEGYREALRLSPDYSKAHYNLGVVYYASGKMDKAVSEYRKALKLTPDLPRIRELEGTE